MENGIDAFEVIKYLFSIIISIGGVYFGFVIKSISKDISQLKELLQTQIMSLKEDVKEDVSRLRKDADQLYDLNRSIDTRITKNETELQALRVEFDKCQEKKK